MPSLPPLIATRVAPTGGTFASACSEASAAGQHRINRFARFHYSTANLTGLISEQRSFVSKILNSAKPGDLPVGIVSLHRNSRRVARTATDHFPIGVFVSFRSRADLSRAADDANYGPEQLRKTRAVTTASLNQLVGAGE